MAETPKYEVRIGEAKLEPLVRIGEAQILPRPLDLKTIAILVGAAALTVVPSLLAQRRMSFGGFSAAREDDILHETDNLYLYRTPKGLEIRMNGPTHAIVIGKPKDIESAKRSMRRMEMYPDNLRSMYGGLRGFGGFGAIKADHKAQAEEQLAPYGYTLDSDGQIIKGNRPLQVKIERKGQRFRAVGPNGNLLWSGPDLSHFVEKFWYAKKIG